MNGEGLNRPVNCRRSVPERDSVLRPCCASLERGSRLDPVPAGFLHRMWVKIGGVLCPGLESLPWLRVAGTPRDQPSAVECPMMMPTDVCASWMTRVLFAGGYVGPRSPVAAAHGAIVHAIESMTDISDDGTVWRIKVAYGVARGTRLDRESQLAARLPDSFILKLYDDTPSNTARGHNESMLSRAPTPAHEPICFWSCLNPPGGAGVMPLVDPSTVSLLSWLRDEEWCAFDPEIKRRYAREARERRQAERERRQAEDEAREAERLRREEAGEESPEDEDEDEEEEDEDEDEVRIPCVRCSWNLCSFRTALRQRGAPL